LPVLIADFEQSTEIVDTPIWFNNLDSQQTPAPNSKIFIVFPRCNPESNNPKATNDSGLFEKLAKGLEIKGVGSVIF